MITVRFPTGVSITYNEAKWYQIQNEGICLFTANPEKGGVSVAYIQKSAGAVLEFVKACSIRNSVNGKTNGELVNHLRENLRSINDWCGLNALKELKKDLAKLDSRTSSWRG